MSNFKKLFSKPRTIIFAIIIMGLIYLILKSNKLIPEYPERYDFIIVLIIILWGIIYFLKKYIIYIKSKKWLCTSAVIEECKTIRTDDSEGTTYTPIVLYKYMVGGQKYISDKINPYEIFLASSFESISNKFIEKYYKNQIIKAYYNPVNPQESYIERKGIIPLVFFLIISIFFFIFIFLFIIGVINL
jgi:hypothetical protein